MSQLQRLILICLLALVAGCSTSNNKELRSTDVPANGRVYPAYERRITGSGSADILIVGWKRKQVEKVFGVPSYIKPRAESYFNASDHRRRQAITFDMEFQYWRADNNVVTIVLFENEIVVGAFKFWSGY